MTSSPSKAQAEALKPGQRIDGRYRVDTVLKNRDHIQVVRALDQETGRDVKIKRLAPGGDEKWFRREADLLANLDHPRVPRTEKLFEFEGHLFAVQTYFHGDTVREYFKRRKQLTRRETLDVLRSTLEILVYLHGRTPQVVHRDLKPANMVLLADNEVALIDFGIATAERRNKHMVELQDLTAAHTVGYGPPEQVIGLEGVAASDLYALGAAALYMNTGIHPVRLWDSRAGRLKAPGGMDRDLAQLFEWLTEPGLAARCPDARDAFSAVLVMQQKDFIAANLPKPSLRPRPAY